MDICQQEENQIGYSIHICSPNFHHLMTSFLIYKVEGNAVVSILNISCISSFLSVCPLLYFFFCYLSVFLHLKKTNCQKRLYIIVSLVVVFWWYIFLDLFYSIHVEDITVPPGGNFLDIKVQLVIISLHCYVFHIKYTCTQNLLEAFFLD